MVCLASCEPVPTNYLLPAANGKHWRWSHGEPATGLPWVPPEKQKAVRKKSTETHAVCEGGPLHNMKIKRLNTIGSGKSKRTVAIMPERFRVPPWAGAYLLDRDTTNYKWTSGGK